MADRVCAVMMEDGEEVILVSTTTHLPEAHVRRRRFNPWLLVIGLAAALLALGAWVAIDRATRSEPENLASSEVVAMVKAQSAAAYQAYDAKAAAAFFAKDAVMEELDPMVPNGHLVTTGQQQIFMRTQMGVDYFRQMGWRDDVGGVIQTGRLVAATHTFGVPGEEPYGELIVVDELDKSGKIAHEWAFVRWLRSPP